MSNNEVIERILLSSCRASDKRSSVSVFACLVEEVGELARALNRPERCDEPAISELADVMNCIVDLAFIMKSEALAQHGNNVKDHEIKEIICKRVIDDLGYFVNKKCNKWDTFAK